MITLSEIKLPGEVILEIANRESEIRKQKKISQSMLAKMTGVSLGSIQRFEQTGKISLESLIKIAFALRCEKDFDELFSHRCYTSLKEVLNETE